MSAGESGSGRHYRVTTHLKRLEGGRPAPGFRWEGGQPVDYEPGQTIYVDDRELAETVYVVDDRKLARVSHHLEALDDAGRAALAEIREPTAKQILVDDLHPLTVEWIKRSLSEKLYAAGNMRKLVLGMLTRGEDPTNDDLAAALEESPDEPLPRELTAYLAKLLRGQLSRKPGRKAPPRTTGEDLYVRSVYHIELEDLRVRYAGQKRAPVKRWAIEKVAEKTRLSIRTVERIVAPRPLTKTRKT